MSATRLMPGSISRSDNKTRQWPRVDIVTVFYNSEKVVADYLGAARKIDYPADRLHFFLIDNASTDSTFKQLKDNFSEMPRSLIRKNFNGGFAAGCNSAMRVSTAKYVFLLNPDTQIHPNCLKLLVERADYDRAIGMVEAAQQPIEHPKYYDPLSNDTSWCSGACTLIRRSALNRTGVFDEKFFMYVEDVDLSWRMWSRGYRCVYLPLAKVQHMQGIKSIKGGMREYYFGLRNGLMMRAIFSGWRAAISYLFRMSSLAIFSSDITREQRGKIFLAILSALKKTTHIYSRRIEQSRYPASGHTMFYGWDYHARR